MSADRKTSKGAPFEICVANFPDDPSDKRTLLPVVFSKSAMVSFMAKLKSDAAATVTSAAYKGRTKQNIMKVAKRVFLIDYDSSSIERLDRL